MRPYPTHHDVQNWRGVSELPLLENNKENIKQSSDHTPLAQTTLILFLSSFIVCKYFWRALGLDVFVYRRFLMKIKKYFCVHVSENINLMDFLTTRQLCVVVFFLIFLQDRSFKLTFVTKLRSIVIIKEAF